MAGTGSLSEPSGSQSLAASCVPSESGIQVFSITRTECGQSCTMRITTPGPSEFKDVGAESKPRLEDDVTVLCAAEPEPLVDAAGGGHRVGRVQRQRRLAVAPGMVDADLHQARSHTLAPGL